MSTVRPAGSVRLNRCSQLSCVFMLREASSHRIIRVGTLSASGPSNCLVFRLYGHVHVTQLPEGRHPPSLAAESPCVQ